MGMVYYNSETGSFHTKELCSGRYSIKVDFYFPPKNGKNRFLSNPFGDLAVTYALYL